MCTLKVNDLVVAVTFNTLLNEELLKSHLVFISAGRISPSQPEEFALLSE